MNTTPTNRYLAIVLRPLEGPVQGMRTLTYSFPTKQARDTFAHDLKKREPKAEITLSEISLFRGKNNGNENGNSDGDESDNGRSGNDDDGLNKVHERKARRLAK